MLMNKNHPTILEIHQLESGLRVIIILLIFSLPDLFWPASEESSCGFRWRFNLAQNSCCHRCVQVGRNLGR